MHSLGKKKESTYMRVCPQKKLVNQSLTFWGVSGAYLTWRKADTNSIEPALAILFPLYPRPLSQEVFFRFFSLHLWGEKKLRNICDFHSPDT